MPITVGEARKRYIDKLPESDPRRAKIAALNAGNIKKFAEEASKILKATNSSCPDGWGTCKNGECVPPGEKCSDWGLGNYQQGGLVNQG